MKGKKITFFDLETGVRISKENYFENHDDFCFNMNVEENLIYQFTRQGSDNSCLVYNSYKFENFKPKAFSGKSELILLNKKLEEFLSKEGLETTKKDGKNLTDFNIIDQYMQGVSSSEISEEIKNRKWPQKLQGPEGFKVSKALIFRFLALKCKKFVTHFDDVHLKERDSSTVMEIFRYPFSTSLSHSNFKMIGQALSEQDKQVLSSGQPDEIDLEMSLSIMKILNANLQALSYCSVNLKSLLSNETEYNEFLKNFIVGGCIHKLAKGSEIEQQKASDAEKELWVQISDVSKDIMTASIKVVSKGPSDIMNHLKDNIDKGEGQKCQSHISHLAEIP